MAIALTIYQRDAACHARWVARGASALVILLALLTASWGASPEPAPTPVATLSPPPVATLSPRAHAQAAVTRGDQARANGDLAQALAE